MNLEMSDAARLALIEHLEGVLCDPIARVAPIRRLNQGATLAIDDWNPLFVQQILDDPRRLMLLKNAELQQLHSDPIGLQVLGEEIATDWWPAWSEPLAIAGRAIRTRANGIPPAYEDVCSQPSGNTFFESEEAEEWIGQLGDVLAHAHHPKQRPLLFEWTWKRTLADLNIISECQQDNRLVVDFRLRAYGRRQGTPGEWILYIAGEPPRSHANVEIKLAGWGHDVVDLTSDVNMAPGGIEIRLTAFPDSDSIFADWPSGKAEVSIRCFGGPWEWHTRETVPAPYLDRSFYEVWVEAKRDDGMDNCLARIVALMGGKGRIGDIHTVYDAIIEASRQIYRRRYAGRYRRIASAGDFTRAVIKAASRHYRRSMKKAPWHFSLFDQDTDIAAPSLEATTDPRYAKIIECLSCLSSDYQTIMQLRYEQNLSFREIDTQMGSAPGVARIRHLRARRKLAECCQATQQQRNRS
jgi:DNA-directed RNA polymerase specialized sigma24 family protein